MAELVMPGATGDLHPASRAPSALRGPTTLTETDLGCEDAAVLRPRGGIELVVGQSFAPFELCAAGFRSLSSLVGAGKVIYRGVRDDHHVFEHASGAFYEPVSRLRPPGPRGFLSRSTLQLDCGALIAKFTDARHVWVCTQPEGLSVKGSTVSFSFHFHQAADGGWVGSAWDPAHVRPGTGFLTMAPLASLHHIAEVILPAIAAGLADLPAACSGSASRTTRELRVGHLPVQGRALACPSGPLISASAVKLPARMISRLALVAVIVLAVVGLTSGSLDASTLNGGPEQRPPDQPSLDSGGSAPGVAPAVPTGSGAGRRIVYCNTCQRVWLVEADDSVARSYQVSGRLGVPSPGFYSVKSKSDPAGTASGMRLGHMVRFAQGRTEWIGFHAIPVGARGPIESLGQLGQPLSHGCVRQDPADAQALWDFAPVGTPVVVVD